MQRLTAEDRLMLWPDELWPQDIGALLVLEGHALLDDDGAFRLDAAREAIRRRLHLAPRLRQVLYRPGRGRGRPLWVDDPDFDLVHHIQLAQVPAPGDEAALLRTVETLRGRRLDMSRPLWEMWFLTGLAGDRIGLFVRLHHVVADGVAGVATMGAFLDVVPIPPTPLTPRWTPAPPPTTRRLVLDNLRGRAAGLRALLTGLLRPVTTGSRAGSAWATLRELLVEDRAPVTSLNRVIGADRRLALARMDLDDVRAVAHAHGATINDVLLTLTAGGLRALLRGRGEGVDASRVYVPVTLRPPGERGGARGNLISQMVVPLPLRVADPATRLRLIAADTAGRKARHRPSLGALLGSRLVSGVVLALLRRNPVNVETADVPGPPVPLYFAGARVLEVFPLLNLIGNVCLGVGALSYAGRFEVMAVADMAAVPDLATFVAGLEQEWELLATTPAIAAVG